MSPAALLCDSIPLDHPEGIKPELLLFHSRALSRRKRLPKEKDNITRVMGTDKALLSLTSS